MTSSSQRASRHLAPITGLLCLATIVGCQSTGGGLMFGKINPGRVDFERVETVRAVDADEEPPGLLDRLLLGKGDPVSLPRFGGRPSTPKKRTLAATLATRERLDRDTLNRAQSIYERGNYAEASKLFADVARQRDPKKFSLFKRSDKERKVYDPVREEAIFYLAECEFMQNRLVKANDQYKLLVKDFPQSRYLDESTRRMFDIAQRWLEVEDFAIPSEIQQVKFDGSHDTPLSIKKPKKRRFGFLPNFTDKSRPAIDVSGHAVETLKTIWLNDPTGPLADDALMLAATYHLRAGNHRDSARLLKILREEFPKSPHLKSAFVIGSHVELMSYQGSSYDEQNLLEAMDLKESSLRLFPGENADRLRGELKKIDDERARREWDRILFWEKKNKPKAVAVYCRELLQNFPTSNYAGRAQAKLVELGLAEPANNTPAPEIRIGPADGRVPVGGLNGGVAPFRSQPDLQPAGEPEDEGPVFEPAEPIINPSAPGGPTPSSPVGRVKL